MIIDTAFAMDGGSLCLTFTEGERRSDFMMDRSIASLDTPQYEQISNESGMLSLDERAALLRRLRVVRSALAEDDPNVHVVDEFLKVPPVPI